MTKHRSIITFIVTFGSIFSVDRKFFVTKFPLLIEHMELNHQKQVHFEGLPLSHVTNRVNYIARDYQEAVTDSSLAFIAAFEVTRLYSSSDQPLGTLQYGWQLNPCRKIILQKEATNYPHGEIGAESYLRNDQQAHTEVHSKIGIAEMPIFEWTYVDKGFYGFIKNLSALNRKKQKVSGLCLAHYKKKKNELLESTQKYLFYNTDCHGNDIYFRYDYDPQGRELQILTYDLNGKFLKHIIVTYNTFHQTTETDGNGNLTNDPYDFAGRLASIILKRLQKSVLRSSESFRDLTLVNDCKSEIWRHLQELNLKALATPEIGELKPLYQYDLGHPINRVNYSDKYLVFDIRLNPTQIELADHTLLYLSYELLYRSFHIISTFFEEILKCSQNLLSEKALKDSIGELASHLMLFTRRTFTDDGVVDHTFNYDWVGNPIWVDGCDRQFNA